MEEEIPEMITVEVSSIAEQMLFMQKMSSMQRTHNTLAKDMETMLLLASEYLTDADKMQPLIRACIKEFFSLVESDLYLINQFIPYSNFNERDDLGRKFKKTYRQHARTFRKKDIVRAFQDKFYKKFFQLKLKRDEIVHPKGRQSIEVTGDDLDRVCAVYSTYRNFIIQLMTNIGVSTKVPWENFRNGNIRF